LYDTDTMLLGLLLSHALGALWKQVRWYCAG